MKNYVIYTILGDTKFFFELSYGIFFYIIELHEFIGDSQKKMERMKGRVIGKDGKMRSLIEDTTQNCMSAYGKTISLIGNMNEIELAKEAIKMLLSGSAHSTVITFLNRKKRELMKKENELKKLNLEKG